MASTDKPDLIQTLKPLLSKHLDKIMIGSLGFITALLGFLAFAERSTVQPEAVPPKPRDPIFAITKTAMPYRVISELVVKRLEPFESSPYHPLTDFNMFDPKSVKDAEQRQKDADKLVGQAQTLVEQAKYDEARLLLDQVFKKLDASYKPAKLLLEEIDKRIKATPAPGAPAKKPEGK